MGGLRYDIRELPQPMREQVAQKIVAQMLENQPVAGQAQKVTTVRVRKLRFPNSKAKDRYLVLKDAVRERVISDLRIEEVGEKVYGFRYRLQWVGEFIPTAIPVDTLQIWRKTVEVMGRGITLYERLDGRCSCL